MQAKIIQIVTADSNLYALDADGRVYIFDFEKEAWLELSYKRVEARRPNARG